MGTPTGSFLSAGYVQLLPSQLQPNPNPEVALNSNLPTLTGLLSSKPLWRPHWDTGRYHGLRQVGTEEQGCR